LSHFAPHDALQLDGRIHTELSAIQDGQEWLQSFGDASDLPLPRPLTYLFEMPPLQGLNRPIVLIFDHDSLFT
jgi:hypothetical protein